MAQEGVPFEDYAALPEVNASGLCDILVSPRNYRRKRDRPPQDRDTLRLGRAAHAITLEPELFRRHYAVYPGRRQGKAWEAFAAANADKTVLTQRQLDAAIETRDAILEHPEAAQLLSESGRAELTIRWTHPRTGTKCKSRIDWLCSALVDLKTTRDPEPRRFSYSCVDYDYATRMAFYSDAVAESLGVAPPVVVIAAQNVEPFDVVVYELPERVLRLGVERYERALDRLMECERTGQWPGIAPDRRVELRLPEYAYAETDDDEPLTFGGEAVAF